MLRGSPRSADGGGEGGVASSLTSSLGNGIYFLVDGGPPGPAGTVAPDVISCNISAETYYQIKNKQKSMENSPS